MEKQENHDAEEFIFTEVIEEEKPLSYDDDPGLPFPEIGQEPPPDGSN